MAVNIVRGEYDFSNGVKNPYEKSLRNQITINLNSETVEYFKSMAETTGIPYQTLINLYLTDCARNKRELKLAWA